MVKKQYFLIVSCNILWYYNSIVKRGGFAIINKVTLIGIIICIGGFVCGFACIAFATAWPTIISILVGTTIGIPMIWYGVEQKSNLVKQSDGSYITVTENNEIALKHQGFYISKICKFSEDLLNNKKYSALYLDDKNKQWTICYYNSNQFKVYKYTDLNSFELFENGTSKVQGRTGSALVGGYFFGVVGAIAGASRSKTIDEICSSLQVKINVKDLNNPVISITLNNTPITKSSNDYLHLINLAKSLIGNLEYINSIKNIVEAPKIEKVINLHNSVPLKEQLQELKDMLKEGLITQEEFEQKKKQILNL